MILSGFMREWVNVACDFNMVVVHDYQGMHSLMDSRGHIKVVKCCKHLDVNWMAAGLAAGI